jgi:hypothetical protein
MPPDVHAKVVLPFDIPTLVSYLNANDQLALVIRARLYVEAVLIRQIEAVLVNREQFDSAALSFSTKVKLAASIGKLESADIPALMVLNKLRNRFAHNLNMRLNRQDQLDLHNVLSKRQRKFVDAFELPDMDPVATPL